MNLPMGAIAQEDFDLVAASDLFDADWYQRAYPDVGMLGIGPVEHYLWLGWRLGRQPSPRFDGRHYYRRYPDIGQAGINPLLHYLRHGTHEKRSILGARQRWDQQAYQPLVSVIVPNYNHARYLDQRIHSILAQGYGNMEILLLDDCSSDDSRAVIARYEKEYPDRVRAILNDQNSGNVFRQWQRGVEAARGDLIWICESDDFCEPDFLEQLVPAFADESVNIAFGRIQLCDHLGRFQPWLDQYREGAEPGIWDSVTTRPAAQWFRGALGVSNVIANVGGCVLRRQTMPDAVWAEAQTYRVLGDWFLYMQWAGGGQITYVPGAVAHFRQHDSNTSGSSATRPSLYKEHEWAMLAMRARWGTPEPQVRLFAEKLTFQYNHFGMPETAGPIEQHFDVEATLRQPREQEHVLIAFLGFHLGGGEVFPIALANELRRQGVVVSMLALDNQAINAGMRQALEPGIAVYDADAVFEAGIGEFIRKAGITVIHSHVLAVDVLLIEQGELPEGVAYVSTLHGSYDGTGLPAERVAGLAARMDGLAYLADKNLDAFTQAGVDLGKFTKLPNAMPQDPLPFPRTRAEMGIAPDAVVFTLVARGIQRKGWRAAIGAFKLLRARRPDVAMHLLLAGQGDMASAQQAEHGADPDISFLGYQNRIAGLYRLSDCAVVPTRFQGESFPLCIIEAFQAGTPVVATDIGEIGAMLAPSGKAPGGVLVEHIRDTGAFIAGVADAMEQMLDPVRRARLAANASALGEDYRMDDIALKYRELYRSAIRQRRSACPA